MAIRVAFIGFRHPHIFALYKLLAERKDVAVVAACEQDEATRAALPGLGVTVTHDTYARMLDEAECEVVACGDYFAIRGEHLIRALERGRHVLGDKPLCTTLSELARIRELSRARGLRVGCMLDLGDLGPYVTLREMIRRRVVGEVHTVAFLGQHPLLYGKRPRWFFEPGKHGGTLNDIAIHGIDIIPWLTGRRIVEITAARAWNARIQQHPDFQDGAALMLRLDNHGVVLGDVSYLSSDRHGYQMAPYWRFTISGTDGVIETSCNAKTVTLWRHDAEAVIEELVAPNRTGGFFDEFLLDLAGAPSPEGLSTARVLESSRIALLAQRAAESGKFPVACPA
jgi:predicted dehydrogenase